MSKTVFIKSHKLIVIFFLIVNCAITVAVKSDPTQTIKSKHGFFANEMFCGDRNYPIPTMTKGDRDFTKDCYKIGSFTNMESLFNSKKILKSET